MIFHLGMILPDTISYQTKVSYTKTTALVQLIYIDTSPDPEFFTVYITRSHMSNFSHTYIVVTSTKTAPIII